MKAFNKDIVRSIRHSLGRFVAIAAIVALGCGFYAGLRMTAPDMKLAADAYYDGTDLMDIRVVSTLGLTDEDIEALRDVPGVSGVEAAYSADVLATLNDEQYVMRVHSLSPSAATAVKTDAGAISSDDANYLNRLDLVEGRWPTSANECVIFNDRVMSGPSSLGDTVTVDPSVGNVQDTLAETEFTVVGRVHSPLYVSSTSMGTSARAPSSSSCTCCRRPSMRTCPTWRPTSPWKGRQSFPPTAMPTTIAWPALWPPSRASRRLGSRPGWMA